MVDIAWSSKKIGCIVLKPASADGSLSNLRSNRKLLETIKYSNVCPSVCLSLSFSDKNKCYTGDERGRQRERERCRREITLF